MSTTVSLSEAKTYLSSLLERVANGEKIVITRHGVPYAQLTPLANRGQARKPANALQVSNLADDFDAVDARVASMFEGGG